jgi:hypothetical protein
MSEHKHITYEQVLEALGGDLADFVSGSRAINSGAVKLAEATPDDAESSQPASEQLGTFAQFQ